MKRLVTNLNTKTTHTVYSEAAKWQQPTNNYVHASCGANLQLVPTFIGKWDDVTCKRCLGLGAGATPTITTTSTK